jgi:hypothetical protein
MRDRKKVIAAIMSAVSSYLQEEEAARAEAPAVRAPVLASAWAVAGRQEIMQMRRFWQLRICR